ncbi:class I SAM-dependent methyltransferase [Saccharopolyspora sp. HNM0983]|uniref:Class I SAM-dependent methyltransferase n=1 Tax=Saccharopolyspora montiporae TaxID=2781240 RepID=A0A929G2Q1_9PSEU|nr:class I SAM-dependent methyltransferase [Saccharopolyspora sp. HNM0983]MBE9376043.1 class I SAM-dependent methyltransferase [Saccharopolyspora sp. HNM0983]
MHAHDQDERRSVADLLWRADPNEWVRKRTAQLPAGRALDLGSGKGRNAVWLATRGWAVTAVDFSRVALDEARRLEQARAGSATHPVRWVPADAADYEPDGAFDLVLVVHLHVPAQQRAEVLRRAARSLAPGGRLLVVGHHADNLTAGTGGPQDPDLLYTQHDLLADLAGFPELATRFADRTTRLLGGGPRPALDVVAEFQHVPGGSGALGVSPAAR